MAVRKCDLGVGRGQSPTTVSLHSRHVRGERQGVGDDLEVVSAGAGGVLPWSERKVCLPGGGAQFTQHRGPSILPTLH